MDTMIAKSKTVKLSPVRRKRSKKPALKRRAAKTEGPVSGFAWLKYCA
jgi:hypothetical protein